ncbi:MAG: site-specific DNA-methyltransferase [Desulfuromonadaceae bacterium]|nr:site-specific DNA-methyltransferase [Desulfuromonadaceae bacterium]
MAKAPTKIAVETLTHDEATRKNIPTAEHQSLMHDADKSPVRIAYERRNRDLDPQLVWRGKDEQDWSDLVVQAPPLYIQEKVHPKVLIDDLLCRSKAEEKANEAQFDLFADFNGLPSESAKTEFYQHDAHWANRMILGDSLQVMASLAEREGLRGKVQSIFFDPPYGIKFNSNFQWSTTDRSSKSEGSEFITREPEQVKAFRDTWRDGIHSYLTYLRDRMTVARDLLSDTGSMFVQIGDENVHRVRALMDEVFGDENFIGLIWFRKKTMPLGATYLERMGDYVVWFGKNKEKTKFRRLYKDMEVSGDFHWNWRQIDVINRRKYSKKEIENNPSGDPFRLVSMWPPSFSAKDVYDLPFHGKKWPPAPGQCYPSGQEKLERIAKADRLVVEGNFIRYVMKLSDDNTTKLNLTWTDTIGARDQNYVVETNELVVQRCILMTTDPGDLVLDPTCGSGTTAYVAEQWGRRWITIDTSRVALALARARIMGARYPYFLLADSRDGQIKEAEVTRSIPSSQPTRGDIRQGFVYERVPHISLKSIANNIEIDVIWEKYQEKLELLLQQLNQILSKKWEEWEVPSDADIKWSESARKLHVQWWEQRIARQKEIDDSVAAKAKADSENIYDKPYPDPKKLRVAGPFTVESLTPHRVLTVGADDELIDTVAEQQDGYGKERDFVQMILENLKTAGVQQAHKEDKITFTALVPWPGDLVCAEGLYVRSDDGSGNEKRAAIFIGPEFGTVSRPDLVQAAREAGDAGFDVLIACAFNYDAHSSEFDKLGRIPVLKARMNADLHMADDLKNTGKGNLFVIFGEPDIDISNVADGQIQVKVNGVDVFHPNTGEVRSDGAEGIACWFIDTDYNEESFFVRHAYFLGANDPYKALKTTLKAEINEDAWATLNSDTSRPFDKPKTGRIAVKVINHLGDEVMKVFRV